MQIEMLKFLEIVCKEILFFEIFFTAKHDIFEFILLPCLKLN